MGMIPLITISYKKYTNTVSKYLFIIAPLRLRQVVDFSVVCSCQHQQVLDHIKCFNYLSNCGHKQHYVNQGEYKL
jgi:hypothetical protein